MHKFHILRRFFDVVDGIFVKKTWKISRKSNPCLAKRHKKLLQTVQIETTDIVIDVESHMQWSYREITTPLSHFIIIYPKCQINRRPIKTELFLFLGELLVLNHVYMMYLCCVKILIAISEVKIWISYYFNDVADAECHISDFPCKTIFFRTLWCHSCANKRSHTMKCI